MICFANVAFIGHVSSTTNFASNDQKRKESSARKTAGKRTHKQTKATWGLMTEKKAVQRTDVHSSFFFRQLYCKNRLLLIVFKATLAIVTVIINVLVPLLVHLINHMLHFTCMESVFNSTSGTRLELGNCPSVWSAIDSKNLN